MDRHLSMPTSRYASHRSDRRVSSAKQAMPTGVGVAVGCAVVVVAAFVAAMVPTTDSTARLVVMSVSVAALGAWSADWMALLIATTVAFLVTNGFLVDRLGELTWHGGSDGWRLLSLGGCALLGLLVGGLVRLPSARRDRTDPSEDPAAGNAGDPLRVFAPVEVTPAGRWPDAAERRLQQPYRPSGQTGFDGGTRDG